MIFDLGLPWGRPRKKVLMGWVSPLLTSKHESGIGFGIHLTFAESF